MFSLKLNGSRFSLWTTVFLKLRLKPLLSRGSCYFSPRLSRWTNRSRFDYCTSFFSFLVVVDVSVRVWFCISGIHYWDLYECLCDIMSGDFWMEDYFFSDPSRGRIIQFRSIQRVYLLILCWRQIALGLNIWFDYYFSV